MALTFHSSEMSPVRVWQPEMDVVDDDPTSSSVQFHVEIRRRTTHLLFNRSEDGTASVEGRFEDPLSVEAEAVRIHPQAFMLYHDIVYGVLSDMLSNLRIHQSCHQRIIEAIISHGLQIGNRVSNMGRKILPLVADIHVKRKYVCDERFLDNWAMRESMAEGPRMVSATESSIKSLKRVRMEGGDQSTASDEAASKRRQVSTESSQSENCTICLEELPVGSYAMRMPCLHVFHGKCIVRWLKESHFCPICRFEMPIA